MELENKKWGKSKLTARGIAGGLVASTEYPSGKIQKKEMQKFNNVLDELRKIKSSKAQDYNKSWRALGLEGINYQIASKFMRLWGNKNNIEKLKNESMRDTYRDLAIYVIMAIQLIDENDTDDKIMKILK